MNYVPKDTQARGATAVLVSLVPRTDGTTRLVFDDVSRQDITDSIDWTHRALFSTVDLPTRELEDLSLSEQDFARIGESVVIRLLALSRRA